jgi:hypothetical protein
MKGYKLNYGGLPESDLIFLYAAKDERRKNAYCLIISFS